MDTRKRQSSKKIDIMLDPADTEKSILNVDVRDVRDRQHSRKDGSPAYSARSQSTGSSTGSSSGPGFGIFNTKLLLFFVTYYFLLIHYTERTRYRNSLEACQWDNWEPWKTSSGEQASVAPHRVAFIADPQLVDDHTYPKLPRVFNYIIRRMSDNYHHTSYRYLQKQLMPETTIFIGDLFDGGRGWDDAPWLAEYNRFNRIFPEYEGCKSYRGLPGNHDIGFQTVHPARVERFAKYFGKPNDVYVLGNHTFIQLDTISLSHEDPDVHTAPRRFLEHAKSSLDPSLPRIFLTHVPLYRDPSVEKCGAGRESPRPFPLMRGVEYQTVIDFTFSEDILKSLSPVLVFSGDDHDYCDMTHMDYSDNSKLLAREISCKTNSMTNGIKKPAIQLLALNNPQDGSVASEKTYETTMCYLPSPYLGVKAYLGSLAVSFFGLFMWFLLPSKVLKISNGKLRPASLGQSSREKRLAFLAHWVFLITLVASLLSVYNRM